MATAFVGMPLALTSSMPPVMLPWPSAMKTPVRARGTGALDSLVKTSPLVTKTYWPFSLASLNGQYVFVTSGEVFTSESNAPVPLARTGVFIADGQGNITGGMEDVNANGIPTNAVAITSGTYTVSADGR